MSKVALATCAAIPQLTADDRLLASALGELGVGAAPAVWNDVAVDWARFDGVVIRWDYHLQLLEFLAWLDRLEVAGIAVWNTPRLVRWNAHKGYLRELEAASVPVVPTRWVERGVAPSLAAMMIEEGWAEAVAKPAVSATAYRTIRMTAKEAPMRQAEFAAAADQCDMLVQPYLPEIEQGEQSLMFVDGAFSHAVLKRPAAGDFRVQSHFGGREEVINPAPATVEQARAALAIVKDAPLFARIDGLELSGAFVLMELELIEPVLFLGTSSGAARRVAEAISRQIG